MYIIDSFKTILKLIKEKELITTFASRTLFIYSSIIYNSCGYINNISNTDNYKNMLTLELEKEEIDYYFKHICLFGLSLLNETFNSKEVYDYIVKSSDILLADIEYTNFKEKYVNEINQIEIDLNDYYYSRDLDGWHDSNEQIQLTNKKTKIDLEKDTLWEQIYLSKWTPINKQKIIGANWGKVHNLLEKDLILQIDQIEKNVLEEYSKIDLEKEHKFILDNSLNLSEESKIFSEFWFGIQDNITIGGFYNYLLICYLENNYLDTLTQIKLLHILNLGIFQLTISIWKLKFKIEDPSPLQVIRGSGLSLDINYYHGESNTDFWLPYKNFNLNSNTNISSEPDYPSDIAGISSIGSFILEMFLPEDFVNLNIIIPKDDIEFISDMICTNSDTNLNFIDWKIKKLSSKITSNSPTNDIVLNIKNWKDLAKIIGYSPVNTGVSTIFSINSGYNLGVNLGKIIINHFL
jgi:hypothetical protein